MKIRVEMGNQKEGKQRVVTETGELVEGVRKVSWSARASENPHLIIEFFPSRVEFDLGEEHSVGMDMARGT